MKRIWFQMSYDKAEGRWVVDADNELLELRCGNFLEIRIGDKGIPCRIELDCDWYVVMQEVRFYLRKKDTYQVDV